MTYDEACAEARKGLGMAGWPQAATATCADIVTHLRNNPSLFACPDQTRVTLVGCGGGGSSGGSGGTPSPLSPLPSLTSMSGFTAWIAQNPVPAVVIAIAVGYMLGGRK